VTVADTASTTAKVLLAEGSTGNLGVKTDAGISYNANTGVLTATGFSGPLTGNVTGDCSGSAATASSASTASTASVASTIAVADTTDTSCVVLLAEDATGNVAAKSDAGLTYNASTGVLTATGFSGPLSGAVTGNVTGDCSGNAGTATSATSAGTAAVATTVTVADTTDTSCSVILAEDSTGNVGMKSDAGITYNAGTGVLTATGFAGPLTGNVTGKASAINEGTVVTAVAAAGVITPPANLTEGHTVVITNGVLTDTYEIVCDGGGVTTPGNIELDTKATAAAAAGSVTPPANPVKGDTFTVDDGTNDDTYEIIPDGTAPSAGNIAVDTSGSAVAASKNLTVDGVVVDGETVTINGEVFEVDTDSSVTGGNTAVDVSGGSAVAAQGTLTISDSSTDDVIDGETVTLGSGGAEEVYEFDWDNSITGGNIKVDISGKASIAKAKGTLTVSAEPVHDDTFDVDSDTYTFTFDATETGSGWIELHSCATATQAYADYQLIGLPADGDTITINGRDYEFDPSNDGIAGDVEFDTNGVSTVDGVLTVMETAINGDGSAVVTAAKDLVNNKIRVTSKLYGTIGNYAVSDSCANGQWTPETVSGGNITTGVAPTTEEIVDQIVSDFDGTTCTCTKKDADQVYFEYDAYGTAGNAIVFTETATGIGVDGAGTLGTTTAGADCSKEDAATALTAKINTTTANPISATDNLDGTMTVEYDVPGVLGDSFVATETMSNGAWDGGGTLGGTQAGVDATKSDFKTAFLLMTPTGVTLSDGGGDVITATASTAGTAGNNISIAEAMANGAWAGAATKLSGGIDATRADACAAIATASAAGTADVVLADNAGASVTVTAGTKGVIGNSYTLAVSDAVNWAKVDPSGGHAGTCAEACSTLETAINGSGTLAITATDHGSTHVDIASDVKGVIGNSIDTTVATGWTRTDLTGGVDGTVGTKGDILQDANFIYICTANNTTADNNWKKVAIA
jgi:hypothetical protein